MEKVIIKSSQFPRELLERAYREIEAAKEAQAARKAARKKKGGAA